MTRLSASSHALPLGLSPACACTPNCPNRIGDQPRVNPWMVPVCLPQLTTPTHALLHYPSPPSFALGGLTTLTRAPHCHYNHSTLRQAVGLHAVILVVLRQAVGLHAD